MHIVAATAVFCLLVGVQINVAMSAELFLHIKLLFLMVSIFWKIVAGEISYIFFGIQWYKLCMDLAGTEA